MLKKVKLYLEASSYDEAINQMAIKTIKPKKSMAGNLKKYHKKPLTKEQILEDLRDKHDRF